MNETTLPYEIREVPDPEGGLRLELHVEGKRIATASAAADILDAVAHQLGLTRQGVADDLRTSLFDLLKNQMEKGGDRRRSRSAGCSIMRNCVGRMSL